VTPGAWASAAIAVLDRVLDGHPVEQALTNWGRGARYAGSSDRAAVRDIVFQCLRCRASFAALGGGLTGRGLFLGFARAEGEASAGKYFSGAPHDPAPPDPVAEVGRALQGAEVYDIPDWLEAPLRSGLGANFAPVMAAMQYRAPVFLRVNPRRGTLARAVEMLEADGILAAHCDGTNFALQVSHGERKIRNTSAFLDGLVELQDLSSQVVVEALPLADGMKVLDHCAGGGGKTLAMAAMAKLKVFAHDAAPRRMADLPARAARAGVKVTLTENPETTAPYDLILVDAPCSGSGSWRRDPEGKWRLTPERLKALTETQAAILDRTAAMVRPGGFLAYVTCSLLAEENHMQIDAFLARHLGWGEERTLSLTPLSGGDGFFLALLKRADT
jgi:16S rRNA (cytosine967-C5)-methyltransferase